MTTTTGNPIGRSFARLVMDAVENPAGANRNDLLSAASDFLDAALASDYTNGLAIARSMAHKATEWAIFSTPESYIALTRAVQCFRMSCAISKT